MKDIENIIIGAGPAGMQMAFFLKKRKQNYLILERSDYAGSFFSTFPRHRKLISINKRYTGYDDNEIQLRYDWNSLLSDNEGLRFSDYSNEYFPNADLFTDYCRDFFEKNDLKIDFNQSISNITKNRRHFILTTTNGNQYRGKRLFIATGLFKENLPDIDGLELCKTYATASINPDDYKDKCVLIIGKGNSAFEVADNLIATTRKIQICGTHHVKMAWQSHYVGDLRAVNNNFIDTYLLKAQNNILDGDIRTVRKENNHLIAGIYFSSRKRLYEFACDEVILCTGFKFDDTIFSDSCRPKLTPCGRFPKMNASWQSTNIKELYFIGTIMQMRDRKKTMSGFIHGFRHNIEALDQILDSGSEWRDKEIIPYQPKSLVDKILSRISQSAAIFLQPGFFCDLFWLDQPSGKITYWHNVPKEYAIEQGIIDNAYTVTLEYKPCNGDTNPLAMPRGIGVEEDFYLHPNIIKYQQGKDVIRYFLADDLDNDWHLLPEHRQKLESIVDDIFVKDPIKNLKEII